MAVLAIIKSVSQEMAKTKDDGSVSKRKIVEFLIGEKSMHFTVFRGLEYYKQGDIGMLEYEVTSEVKNSKVTGDPWVSYNCELKSWKPTARQQSVTENIAQAAHDVAQQAAQEPSQAEVAAAFAEAAQSEKIDPSTGLPF